MEPKELTLPNITASSAKQFAEIEKALKKMPQVILDQIKVVTTGLACAYDCEIDVYNSVGDKLYLPNYTTQITDFEDYIGVYSDKFFFRIDKKRHKNKNFTYLFINCREWIDAGR